MNNYRLSSLFAIPLMEFQYDEVSKLDHSTIEDILNRTEKNISNHTSKDTYILDKHLTNLRKFFESCIQTYVEKVIVGDVYDRSKLNFQITQSWLNKTKPGESHHIHNHANSLISGVFYIKANSSLDNIRFYNDITSYETIKIDGKKFNKFNSSSWSLPVQTGRLILFPSYLSHGVDTTKGDNDRISLSFNVFPFGVFGSKQGATELCISRDK